MMPFGSDKCHIMHVGEKIEEVCLEMHVDGWKMKEVKEIETEEIVLEDEYNGKTKMEEVLEEKYLGDIVSHNGRNMKTIEARVNRGNGIINQIM